MASPLFLFAYTFRLTGMENQFLENKTQNSKVVKLNLISGDPVSIFI
jgi:hypothetical protein